MIIYLVFFIITVVYGIRVCPTGYNDDYLTKKTTNAVKGIFIMVVFMNHVKGYYEQVGVNLSNWYDSLFFLPAKSFGQLMVVMFLFYSGYGVMEGIKKRGGYYVDAIPKRRVLGTLVNFDVAVCIFAITMLLIGIPLSLERFLFSLTGWDSVGNSNWYIFVIVVCYALTYIGQKINHTKSSIITCVMVVVFAFVLSLYKGTWWYNTMFAYGAGLLFSEHKDVIAESMKKNYSSWFLSIGGGFSLCLGTYLCFYGPFKGDMQQLGALVFNVMSVFFAFLVVIITMKVQIGNNVLEWLGTNLFPLYIYQRLSMMVLTQLYPNFLVAEHPYLFFVICVAITCVIAWGYKWINIKIA